MTPEIKSIILDLYAVEAIKFGSFTLKSGIVSPFYIDLRLIISYPLLLKKIVAALYPLLEGLSYSLICGVPYTALPIATALSLEHNIPMIMRRKEAKDYGTKKIVEGAFQEGETCLIIEDVITSGASILETVDSLKKEELQVNDAIVMLNREQGGQERLEKLGISVHPLISVFDLMRVLFQEKKIAEATFTKVHDFLSQPTP